MLHDLADGFGARRIGCHGCANSNEEDGGSCEWQYRATEGTGEPVLWILTTEVAEKDVGQCPVYKHLGEQDWSDVNDVQRGDSDADSQSDRY